MGNVIFKGKRNLTVSEKKRDDLNDDFSGQMVYKSDLWIKSNELWEINGIISQVF